MVKLITTRLNIVELIMAKWTMVKKCMAKLIMVKWNMVKQTMAKLI
jgi:hypothetical protein